MYKALNGIQVFMEAAQPVYDQKFYEELSQCLDQFDPRLFQSTSAQWDGMISYANAGGSIENGDIWQTCDENLKWFESNCTVQEYGSMPIFEVIMQLLLHTSFIAIFFLSLAL